MLGEKDHRNIWNPALILDVLWYDVELLYNLILDTFAKESSRATFGPRKKAYPTSGVIPMTCIVLSLSNTDSDESNKWVKEYPVDPFINIPLSKYFATNTSAPMPR